MDTEIQWKMVERLWEWGHSLEGMVGSLLMVEMSKTVYWSLPRRRSGQAA